MMKACILAVLAGLGGAAWLEASQAPDARPLASFIPVSAGPWLSDADQVFDASTIFDYIDGAGEVYRSYNMKLLVARRFHKDGKPDLVVDAFDMGTSEDAFGVFTHDLDGAEAGIGQGSIYRAGLLTFWKGRYFLSVYTEEETAQTKELVLGLGRAIAAAIPDEGTRPELLAFLPAEGLEDGKVRFFHNHSVLNYHYFVAEADVLGLAQTAKAVLAGYPGPGGESRLLVVEYPAAGAAAGAAASFAAARAPGAGARRSLETPNGRWTAWRVLGRYLAVVFDEPEEAAAWARLEAVMRLIASARAPG